MADLLHSVTQKDRSSAQSFLTPDVDQERKLSRSPHPYHRRATSLLDEYTEGDTHQQSNGEPDAHTTSTPSSESGTEADDERGRFLKCLPAPRLRHHKGLRDVPFEDSTSQPSPLDTPPAVEKGLRQLGWQAGAKDGTSIVDGASEIQVIREKYTKRKRSEVVRRCTETALFFAVALLVSYDHLSEDALLARSSGKACVPP